MNEGSGGADDHGNGDNDNNNWEAMFVSMCSTLMSMIYFV
jgi:hypothetical protein